MSRGFGLFASPAMRRFPWGSAFYSGFMLSIGIVVFVLAWSADTRFERVLELAVGAVLICQHATREWRIYTDARYYEWNRLHLHDQLEHILVGGHAVFAPGCPACRHDLVRQQRSDP